jgi:large subunit ribosomal protein L32
MSVPKKRKTSSKTRKGRSHQALKKVSLNKCPKCGHEVKPHSACGFCGHYKGREVLKIKTKKDKNKQK